MFVIEWTASRAKNSGDKHWYYVRDDATQFMLTKTTDIDRARVWASRRDAYDWAAPNPRLESARVIPHPMRGYARPKDYGLETA